LRSIASPSQFFPKKIFPHLSNSPNPKHYSGVIQIIQHKKKNTMEQRINPYEKGQGAFKAMFGLGIYLSKSPVERSLLNLVYFRVSQINGCAYCLDMHSKDLRLEGETEQRLYMMNAWRESPVYTDRERAALAWAESVTLVSEGNVPNEVYEEATSQFSDEELIDLTLAVITINAYNRVNIAFRTPAGTYEPGQFATHTK
jgi:AhpD family alkylhydroperoxidase